MTDIGDALVNLTPPLAAAALEWVRPDTLATHGALTIEARVYAAAAAVGITAPLQDAFVTRIRIDRVDALAGLYRAFPVVRASALIASATELMGKNSATVSSSRHCRFSPQ